MALIAMAVFDNKENDRTKYTERTLESLYETVDKAFHRVIVVDNASCDKTKAILGHYITWGLIDQLITLPKTSELPKL
jgi:glycosyltransferase involved in cell wall biosynthesis